MAAVLATVGLADRADDRIDTYSGGMKRRAQHRRRAAARAALLILDEPTAGVDPQSRNAILSAVEALGGEGLAVLYTTHYMEEAERLCDRVGIIDQGRLVAEGTRRELVAQVGERGRVRLDATGRLDDLADAARALPTVERAEVAAGGIDLVVDDARRELPRLLEMADRADVQVQSVEVVEPDLEAVFLHLTGKALRD
jgi:ABC-2 type transport system ATP-binding protein